MNQDQQFMLKNLQNMINYIKSETDKKVINIQNESKRSAEASIYFIFIIDKSAYLEPLKAEITAKIEKELNEYKIKIKVEHSQKVNRLRLEKFKIKIDYINSVFEDTRHALLQRIKNKPDDYKSTMKNLLVEGFIKLLDENVNVICKKEDSELVKSLLEPAKAQFLELLKKNSNKFKNFDMTVSLDSKYFLPENIIGGVFLASLKGKIRVDNTLDKRIDLLKQTAIPEIKKLLFKNSN